jgi:hypothetical protein
LNLFANGTIGEAVEGGEEEKAEEEPEVGK